MVYLICFDEKIHHAKHYIGYTKNVEKRYKRHKAGTGSRLLKALNKRGIDYRVVRTWEGDKKWERKLKKRKNAKKLCPVCNPAGYYKQGNK